MTGHRGLPGTARLGATLATLATGEAVLVLAGRRLPPLTADAGRMTRTFDEAEPLLVAVSAVRLVALAVGATLLALAAAGIAARAAGAARLVTRIDRWTPGSLRRILDGALGAGLAVSIGMSSLPAGADPTPAPATTLRLADAPAPTPQPPGSTTTLRRLPDGPPAPAADAAASPAPAPAGPAGPPASAGQAEPSTAGPTNRAGPASPATPPRPATPAAPAAPGAAAGTRGARPPDAPARAGGQREVVVRPGDSFWRVAERHELERLGRQPRDAEVATCWRQLVELNRDRLAVPDNPDLLFPGQILTLPCP